MNATVPEIEGFAPIAGGQPRLLILGSMPGEASLRKREYYGHARNAFWPIMAALLSGDAGGSYAERKKLLIDHGIAVWDVLQSCRRSGSSDANIAMASIKINDFCGFFDHYRSIDHVYFNGGTAGAVYRKHVVQSLRGQFDYLRYFQLPSTSPAHASLNFDQKLDAWRVILQPVVK